ncbi:MAG: hypothetical protein ACR2N0_14920 [Rubrobacteraceae bacterium]
MTSANTAKRKGSRQSAARPTVVLIPGVPAANILTHAAGKARITASLAGKEPLETRNHIIREMGAAAHPREPNPGEEKAPAEKSGDPSAKPNHIIPRTTLDLLGGGARVHISQREGDAGNLIIEGEVMAFDRGCMGRAVEAVMRRVSEAAALSDAILEMKVERGAEPMVACEEAVRDLTRELSGAGFPVRAEVLWRPAPGGDVWLGVGGGEDGEKFLRAFIEESTAWRAL